MIYVFGLLFLFLMKLINLLYKFCVGYDMIFFKLFRLIIMFFLKKYIYIVYVLFRFYILWFIEVFDCLLYFLIYFWCRGLCNNFYIDF